SRPSALLPFAGGFSFSADQRLGIGPPRVQQPVQRPIALARHVLGTTAGRLSPSGVVHLAGRRVGRNLALKNASEQVETIIAPQSGKDISPRVAALPQSNFVTLLALLARAAVLTEPGDVVVEHACPENCGCARSTPGAARSQHGARRIFCPRLRILFPKTRSYGEQSPAVRAARPLARRSKTLPPGSF